MVVAIFADRKLLWTDELFTVSIAQQPTLGRFFDELLHGPDSLPPLTHLATRVSISMLGPTHIAFRLPAAVGFLIALVCIYQFLRVRASVAVSYVGVLALCSANAFPYAYEARPYGLLMGFCALSLLCCQRAAISRRWYWYGGLSIGILGAISSHWYGVMVLVPILAGEIARLAIHRRVDWRMALAITIALIPTPLLRPFAAQAMTFRGVVPPPSDLSDYLKQVYEFANGPVLVCLCLAYLVAVYVRRTGRDDAKSWSVHELVLVGATSALPIAGFVVAQLTGGQSLPRYLMTTAVGVALLVGVVTQLLDAQTKLFGRIALAATIGAAGTNVLAAKLNLQERSWVGEGKGVYWLLKATNDQQRLDDLPIVVENVHDYLPLVHYAKSPLKEKLMYLTGPDVMAGQGLLNMMSFMPLNVQRRDDFIREHNDFYLYEGPERTPLLAQFLAHGATIVESGINDSRDIYPRPGYLFRVVMKTRN